MPPITQVLQFAGNHLLLVALLVIILLALLIITLQEKTNGILALSPQQVVQQMNQDQALLLDIRTNEAYRQQHIINTTQIDVEELLEKTQKLAKKQDKMLIIVDDNGQTATKYATQLKAAGFTQIAILKGGMQQWQVAGLPVIKE